MRKKLSWSYNDKRRVVRVAREGFTAYGSVARTVFLGHVDFVIWKRISMRKDSERPYSLPLSKTHSLE